MNTKRMTTKTGTVRTEHAATVVLEQLAEIDASTLSSETARTVLQLRFGRSHQRRVDALSEKARRGNLTPAEEEELDEFLHVGDLVAILQSKARQALKHASRSS
jgi:hypothetical protein